MGLNESNHVNVGGIVLTEKLPITVGWRTLSIVLASEVNNAFYSLV